MEENTDLQVVSSHELPSVVQALTTRAACLVAHNPDFDSCMCDWLTGLHGGRRTSCHLQYHSMVVYTTTISNIFPYI